MHTYAIMRMPGHKAELEAARRGGVYAVRSRPQPKNMGEINAESGGVALRKFAEAKLGKNYTAREYREEARYTPAFLVCRCWNGHRNNHEVRFEAWRVDR